MKKYLLAIALTAAVASPALAASQHHAYRAQAVNQAYDANEAYAYAAPSSDAVVTGGQILGRDPDAFIRTDIQREGDQTLVSGN